MRIWKARASDKLGVVTTREKAAMEYRDSLRERWKTDVEIGKVSRYVTVLSYNDCLLTIGFFIRSRRLPKPVYTASQLKHTMLEARRVKEERRRKHTRAGENKPKAEKKKVVIAEQS